MTSADAVVSCVDCEDWRRFGSEDIPGFESCVGFAVTETRFLLSCCCSEKPSVDPVVVEVKLSRFLLSSIRSIDS